MAAASEESCGCGRHGGSVVKTNYAAALRGGPRLEAAGSLQGGPGRRRSLDGAGREPPPPGPGEEAIGHGCHAALERVAARPDRRRARPRRSSSTGAARAGSRHAPGAQWQRAKGCRLRSLEKPRSQRGRGADRSLAGDAIRAEDDENEAVRSMSR
jgi:hypothetical protein